MQATPTALAATAAALPTASATGTPAPAATETADSRATTFQAVQGGETQSGEVLVVEAYAVLWVILFTWLALMWRKQARLNARIEDLDRALDRAVASAAKTTAGPAK